MNNSLNIALIHDWLVSMRGGEKVLEVLCELFPNAPLYTLIHRKGSVSSVIENRKIITSFIQRLPFGQKHYQHFLPLFPLAVKRFDLREYDLIISSSHAAAKGVRVRKDTLHLCYCYTPMRYIWDQYEQYFGKDRSSLMTRVGIQLFLNYLRRWDIESSKHVNHFIAISENVKDRIERIYNRKSIVIYPPVDVNRYSLSSIDEGYYLIVSALVPYKRVDLAVYAFNQLGKRLIIIGTGSEEQKLKAKAKSNIEFLGWRNDDDIKKYYQACHALIFPGEEDFGIVPVEAMACGKPVVAYGKGGALETVIDRKTGVLFPEQNIASLQDAIKKLDTLTFDAQLIRDHAFEFRKEIFKEAINEFIKSKCNDHS